MEVYLYLLLLSNVTFYGIACNFEWSPYWDFLLNPYSDHAFDATSDDTRQRVRFAGEGSPRSESYDCGGMGDFVAEEAIFGIAVQNSANVCTAI